MYNNFGDVARTKVLRAGERTDGQTDEHMDG